MQEFHPCSFDGPCERTEEFSVDPIPSGCCVLGVTNGNGLGRNEVSNYEVFLNGERVIPRDTARNVHAPAKILKRNRLKVTLAGDPNSKVFILIAYDPRQK